MTDRTVAQVPVNHEHVNAFIDEFVTLLNKYNVQPAVQGMPYICGVLSTFAQNAAATPEQVPDALESIYLTTLGMYAHTVRKDS
jgi:hypothetical protein